MKKVKKLVLLLMLIPFMGFSQDLKLLPIIEPELKVSQLALNSTPVKIDYSMQYDNIKDSLQFSGVCLTLMAVPAIVFAENESGIVKQGFYALAIYCVASGINDFLKRSEFMHHFEFGNTYNGVGFKIVLQDKRSKNRRK